MEFKPKTFWWSLSETKETVGERHMRLSEFVEKLHPAIREELVQFLNKNNVDTNKIVKVCHEFDEYPKPYRCWTVYGEDLNKINTKFIGRWLIFNNDEKYLYISNFKKHA